jgi:PhoPQ-activated pathogenicity-related protein
MKRSCQALLLFAAVACGLLALCAESTPLDDYVAKDDGVYSYYDTGLVLEGMSPRGGVPTPWKGYVLNMTSQLWLTPEDSTQPVWWHILVVVVPETVVHTDKAILWITGGDNDEDSSPVPAATDEDMVVTANLAVNTGTVCAALFQVPNQHITFYGDPLLKRRSEDSLVAYGWAHFLDYPDEPEWLLLLPMTKAAVKAMDTVENYVKNQVQQPQQQQQQQQQQQEEDSGRGASAGAGATINQWGVAGASKRGWTTWLTAAAVTDRVMLAAPVVFDELNITANLHHHYQAYGGWSFAFQVII